MEASFDEMIVYSKIGSVEQFVLLNSSTFLIGSYFSFFFPFSFLISIFDGDARWKS